MTQKIRRRRTLQIMSSNTKSSFKTKNARMTNCRLLKRRSWKRSKMNSNWKTTDSSLVHFNKLPLDSSSRPPSAKRLMQHKWKIHLPSPSQHKWSPWTMTCWRWLKSLIKRYLSSQRQHSSKREVIWLKNSAKMWFTVISLLLYRLSCSSKKT